MSLCNPFKNIRNQFISTLLNCDALSTALTKNSNHSWHNATTNLKEQNKCFHPNFPEKSKTDGRMSKDSETSKERNP